MTAQYLETAKTIERGTRTFERMCHNFENIVLVRENFDDKKKFWQTKNNYILPVNLMNQYLNKQNRTISTYRNVRKIVKTRRVSVCSSVLWMFFSDSNQKSRI